jgi:hypothetical protein
VVIILIGFISKQDGRRSFSEFFLLFFFFFPSLTIKLKIKIKIKIKIIITMSFVPAETKEAKDEKRKARESVLEQQEEFYKRKIQEKQRKDLTGEVL